jgi:hypothetical protein
MTSGSDEPTREKDLSEMEVRDLDEGAAASLDDAFAAVGGASTASGAEAVKDLGGAAESLAEAVRQAAARPEAPPKEPVEESPMGAVDLDAVEAASAVGGPTGLTGAADMLSASDASVRARLELAVQAEEAQSAYDESLMGGLYVGAFVGAIAGLAMLGFNFGDKLPATVGAALGLALVGGLVGYAIGMAVGAGTRAAVRGERGSQVLLGFGILILAAPIAVAMVALAHWGFTEHLWFAVGAWALVAFYAFVYVYQDSCYRGMGSVNGVVWGLVSAAVPFLVALHTARRPKGHMLDCPSCGKKLLAQLARCPHCGYLRRAGMPSKEELDITNA